MPANQGRTPIDWSPGPLTPPHNIGKPDVPPDTYVPKDYEDCVRYITQSAGIAEIDILDGLPHQRGIVEDLANKVYNPGKDILSLLRKQFAEPISTEPSRAQTALTSVPIPELFMFENRKRAASKPLGELALLPKPAAEAEKSIHKHMPFRPILTPTGFGSRVSA